MHAALVWDTTSFDQGILNNRKTDLMKVFYTSVGAELLSEWTFGFYLPAQVRLGGYHGFGPFGETFYFTMAMEAAL